ncbi:hypothetical protein CXF68_18980 [Tenacibaculum sp. Bg11-29]|uniref:ankyrin repeat domain-containing protein n=1 Tax=Tenacibaculum sp. Bg11-29 TaxID=2058306 RepID=UPI000C33CF78|nr:ankyrin repeat domain-containing protein [Tenacibaculum sp. Bg11-29]PKH52658.1 hypothetical protein CXF68_18980 [Tenacibaculum sp. Bg11-29]
MKQELSDAIISGDLEFLKTYIDNGNDFNGMTLSAPGGYGKEPIELAVLSQFDFKGSFEITKFVVNHSSDENISKMLYSFASEDKYLEKMKALLACDVFVDTLCDNRTALQMATGNGNLKMTHLLLTYGANPMADGKYGTALEEAEGISYEPVYEQMMLSFMKGIPKSPFDFVDKDSVIEKLNSWVYSLMCFGKENQDNTFYVVAIDGSQLVANSIEEFKVTLNRYQEVDPDDDDDFDDEDEFDEAAIEKLKFSSGDFSFHKINKEIDPSNELKFDLDLSFLIPQEKDIRTKNDLLIAGLLKNKELFIKEMNVTDDFKIMAYGHTY